MFLERYLRVAGPVLALVLAAGCARFEPARVRREQTEAFTSNLTQMATAERQAAARAYSLPLGRRLLSPAGRASQSQGGSSQSAAQEFPATATALHFGRNTRQGWVQKKRGHRRASESGVFHSL